MNWLQKTRSIAREEGFLPLLGRAADKMFAAGIEYPIRLLLTRRTFSYCGRDYRYFLHPYNTTWRNERCLELAIVHHELLRLRPASVLEIGNVLSHYRRFDHDIIDKYELGSDVRNEDVEFYAPARRYDFIVTISTLEHVGYDPPEQPDPTKPIRVMQQLRTLLAPHGRLMATIPIGYNPHLDNFLATGALPFDSVCYYRRVGPTSWKKATIQDMEHVCFGSPWPQANGLAIARASNG